MQFTIQIILSFKNMVLLHGLLVSTSAWVFLVHESLLKMTRIRIYVSVQVDLVGNGVAI